MVWCRTHPGGAEVELSLLFADVRGSTTIAEQVRPREFARILKRFYDAATNALIETDAFIDKLVADEVVGLYFPLFAGPAHARRAVEAAHMLLLATGHGEPRGPWIPVGVGVHTGTAFVGTVAGAEGTVSDVAAVGDTVNLTARLSSQAGAGEILMTIAAYQAAGLDVAPLEQRRLQLKGRTEPVDVYVWRVTH